jgi:methylenetetrahydrofolate dehydrogenase (NADP+)/methenyltetrahydrofolate cyclohydrolase
MAKLIDGKKISAAVRSEIAQETEKFTEEHGFAPGLTVIIVGQDPASQVYVRNKKRACEEVGFASRVIEMPENTTQEELLSVIDGLVKDDMVHGILVQLPLPKHIS